jgi:hypothetical protein
MAMGFPAPNSAQIIGWAQGILEELTQNGTATSRNFPGPHPISGMSGASMASKIASYAGYPGVSSTLNNYCNAIVQHIQSNGQVFYTAPVAAPPAIPPPAAWFLNGTISGLSGSTMASLIVSQVGYPGVSSQLLAKCNAIVAHIQSNALVTDGVIA